ncbi:unnamed protein product [Didymodactylos carnosus]|nr:unnamed protein product [Didymodactylos carnosus]CAF4169269.1 unnamed protein product [Didymodactylos carnosus]
MNNNRQNTSSLTNSFRSILYPFVIQPTKKTSHPCTNDDSNSSSSKDEYMTNSELTSNNSVTSDSMQATTSDDLLTLNNQTVSSSNTNKRPILKHSIDSILASETTMNRKRRLIECK